MELYQFKRKEPAGAASCRTPALEDMHRVIQFARTLQGIGAIVGAPGVGKTTALRQYAADHADARYCVMNPALASMTRMLQRVSDALGEPTDATGPAHLHGRICTIIRAREPSVLLIDEAQHLSDASLDALRCIHDETGLPMVFAGNESLRERVTVSSASAFAQFASRIASRVFLNAARAEDVSALASHHGIRDRKAVAWLAKRCAGVAGLRDVSRLMTMARQFVGDGAIQISHLKQADALTGGAS